MTKRVEVVIAIHDESRPIERAVASVLHDEDVLAGVGVIVVCHGIDESAVEKRLASMPGSVRVIRHDDGVRGPGGPFNAGLDAATAEYVSVMGSDDFLDPGAMSAWIAHVRRRQPAALIAPIRKQGQPVMSNPLVRPGRTHDLDPVRDRLFYRTAPLGLLRTARVRELGIRFTEGLRSGEDLAFGVRMWTNGERIDFVERGPCYVIGADAVVRTSESPMTVAETFAAIEVLLDDAALINGLGRRTRRALAVKMIRISVLGAIRARPVAGAWHDAAELEYLSSVLRRILAIAPTALKPFNRDERRILDALRSTPTFDAVLGALAQHGKSGRSGLWFTKNPIFSLDREATLRWLVIYKINRHRAAR